MDWKFKEDAKPCGSSDGLWYDLTDGHYIKPENLLADENQVKALKEAIALIESFEGALLDAELLNEF